MGQDFCTVLYVVYYATNDATPHRFLNDCSASGTVGAWLTLPTRFIDTSAAKFSRCAVPETFPFLVSLLLAGSLLRGEAIGSGDIAGDLFALQRYWRWYRRYDMFMPNPAGGSSCHGYVLALERYLPTMLEILPPRACSARQPIG